MKMLVCILQAAAGWVYWSSLEEEEGFYLLCEQRDVLKREKIMVCREGQFQGRGRAGKSLQPLQRSV